MSDGKTLSFADFMAKTAPIPLRASKTMELRAAAFRVMRGEGVPAGVSRKYRLELLDEIDDVCRQAKLFAEQPPDA